MTLGRVRSLAGPEGCGHENENSLGSFRREIDWFLFLWASTRDCFEKKKITAASSRFRRREVMAFDRIRTFIRRAVTDHCVSAHVEPYYTTYSKRVCLLCVLIIVFLWCVHPLFKTIFSAVVRFHNNERIYLNTSKKDYY